MLSRVTDAIADWFLALPSRAFENEGKIWLFLIGITLFVVAGTWAVFLYSFFLLFVGHAQYEHYGVQYTNIKD